MSGELWSKFCDDLKAAGDDVLRLDTEDPLDAVEGYRLLTRLLRGALEERLEWANSRNPTLICTCHETIKLVAENPDNIYLGCKLRGDCDYRISARAARPNGSVSIPSPAAVLAAAGAVPARPCTRST